MKKIRMALLGVGLGLAFSFGLMMVSSSTARAVDGVGDLYALWPDPVNPGYWICYPIPWNCTYGPIVLA